MNIKSILILASLVVAAPAFADDAASAPGAALTATAAKQATYLMTSNGQTATINSVIAGPDDTIAAVSVIYNDSIYTIPGSTVSAGEKKRLKTSLSSKEVRALKN
jgi:3-hydroxyisobutyrate dehydrogenase-like beta-hydroxyacid dehydrogenase